MKITLLIIIILVIINIPAVTASHITVQYADTVWNTTSEYSSDLMNAASDVTPRVKVEYANSIFRSNLYFLDILNNLATEVPPRIISEYANSVLKLNMNPPSFVDINNHPIAKAGDDFTGGLDSSIIFDGSSSYDPDGEIVSYEWNFGDGSTGSGNTVSHNYVNTGTYTVTLKVTDGQGATDIDTLLVYVLEQSENQPPEIVAIYADKETSAPGEVIIIEAEAIDPEGDSIIYNWYCDGGMILGEGSKASWIASNEGIYHITFEVSDSYGHSQQKAISINVSENTLEQSDLYIGLYAPKTKVKVGEEVPFELSVVNPVTSNEPLIVQLTLKITSGWSITSSGFTSITGGLSTSLYEIEIGDSEKIHFGLKSNQVGIGIIEGYIDYYFKSQEDSKYHKEIFLPVETLPGGEIETQPVLNNSNEFWEDLTTPLLLSIITAIIGGLIVRFIWHNIYRKN